MMNPLFWFGVGMLGSYMAVLLFASYGVFTAVSWFVAYILTAYSLIQVHYKV